ncbi:MAG: lactonase family protein [Terriglobales bacterium]
MCEVVVSIQRQCRRLAGRAVSIVVLLLLFGAYVACGGGGSAAKLYVVGLGLADVQSFSVASSGTLSADATVFGTGSRPDAIVLTHHFAYVLNAASAAQPGAISEFALKSNGTLSPARTATALSTTNLSATPPKTGLNPLAMVADSKTKFVFVANQGSNSISVYGIDGSTGLLTEVTGSPFATGAGPSGLAVVSNTVFVANQGAATISVYSFDQNGVLTAAGSPVAAGVAPTALDVDSSGKFLYAADQGGNTVLAFTISGTSLAPVSGSPFAAGTTPVHVRVIGSAVFVANAGSNNVSAYSISGSGALAAVSGSPFAAGTTPVFIVSGNGGKTAYVANQGSNNISAFEIGSGGALSAVSGSPFATLAASPTALASNN